MRLRTALAVLLPILGTFLLLSVTSSARPADKPSAAEIKKKVQELVEQLGDKEKQDAAAVELLKLGPDALAYLPAPNAKPKNALQKQALADLRKALRNQQIQRDLAPRRVTIDDEQPVSKMLAEVEKQTGIKVEDRRGEGDAKIKLKLNKVTFWQAVDAIAREADGVVEYHNRKGITIQKRPAGYVNPPVAYDGIFRATVLRVRSQLLQEAENSAYVADVEIAWEPRFKPFYVEVKTGEIALEDDKGRKLIPAGNGGGPSRGDKRQIEYDTHVNVFDVPLGSLDRSVPKLKSLKLPLKFAGPTRMETFAFDKTLAEIKKEPRGVEITRDGVTIKVGPVELARDHWTVFVSMEYPAGGPEFESFEAWWLKNQIWLRSKDSEKTFPNDGYFTDSSAANRATIAYHFVDKGKDTDPNKLRRGSPDDWKPVYEAPALIVDVAAAFEFKDIRLP